MKKIFPVALLFSAFFIGSCNNDGTTTDAATGTETEQAVTSDQSSVKDDESQKDVVKVAAGSPDHTTLVAAVKQAELVNVLSNAGPFTVFTPTNAAFDKVPKETLQNLMKDENKAQLQDILQYHVYVGNLSTAIMQDGQSLNQVNGGNITVSKQGDKIMLNNSATIVASIPASNGIIHVIDGVLLPPANK